MQNMRFPKFITTLFLSATIGTASTTFANAPKKPCANFDSVALQLSLAQNNMQPPVNLEQIKTLLGQEIEKTVHTQTTYSWVHRNLVLIVKTDGDNITDKMLTGTSSNDEMSRKIEQAYQNLKPATSIWDVRNVQKQLGPGYLVNDNIQTYTWVCNGGSITITTDQNNNIKTASITYQTPLGSIEKRLGSGHPPWDIQTDSLGISSRGWQRLFGE